jgi:CD80-like C2-set immunoglobulin domain
LFFYAFAVAPETAKITVSPDELKAGVEATLTCDSSSSNPPSTITWHRDGIPVGGMYVEKLYSPKSLCVMHRAHFGLRKASIRKMQNPMIAIYVFNARFSCRPLHRFELFNPTGFVGWHRIIDGFESERHTRDERHRLYVPKFKRGITAQHS